MTAFYIHAKPLRNGKPLPCPLFRAPNGGLRRFAAYPPYALRFAAMREVMPF